MHLDLVDLVIDAPKGRIASKLIVTGKPITEFFGMQPSERTLRFNEVRWCLSSIKGDSLIGAGRLRSTTLRIGRLCKSLPLLTLVISRIVWLARRDYEVKPSEIPRS